jgi:hypothetical protein
VISSDDRTSKWRARGQVSGAAPDAERDDFTDTFGRRIAS